MKSRFQRLKRQITPWVMTYLVEGLLLRILLFTCRIKISGLHHILDTAKAGPCVVACWHNRLILVTYIVRKWVSKLPLCAVVSASGDGQLLSSIIQRLPNMKLIRVSHNNRHHALKLMVHNLKEEGRVLIVTPDGPQGPRYQAKPGTLVAASATDAQLVALSWSATRFWQLNSWDRMIIPKPFSTIHISVSAPFQANQQDSLGRRREQLEAALTQESDTACKALKLSPSQSPT